MAEIVGVDVKPETDISENVPESPPLVSHSPQHVPSAALNNNTASSQQLSTSNSVMSGASNGMTSEQRRKLIAEAEQQRTEQRRQQILETQRRAEEQREKQREERKRRIEENKKREEERQRKALETKKEIERQYKDHMMMLAQRGSSASKNSDQMPAVMRTSHMSTRSHTAGPTSVNGGIGDRMTTSFTVAFGSSAPRSICTKANEAILRSQAAFEARLASYLNGRHSGCFLTQSSAYTTYALYVKPDLLPENHPIRRQLHEGYHVSTPRRAASANPTLCATAAKKPVQSSGVGESGRRAESITRQAPQGQHRSRPTVRLPPPGNIDGTAAANLPQPIRRAASSQHFAEPTIAFASKVKGAPPPEITRKISGDGTLPKRRTVPGRSAIPRDRCNSYAAPTTAWTNRQRANSQDRKPPAPSAAESDARMTISVILPRRKPAMTAPTAKPVLSEGDETQSRSILREQLKQNTAAAQPPQWKTQLTVGPSLTKTAPLKATQAKMTATNKPLDEPAKANTSEVPVVIKRKPKPIEIPKADSTSEVPKLVAEPVPTHPTQTIQQPPTRLTSDLQEIQVEPPAQPTPPPQPAGLVSELPELQTPPPPNSLAAELDLARPVAPSPPSPPETPPPEPFEDIAEIINQQQNREEEEPVQEPPPAFADHKIVPEAETKENNGEILTEQKQQPTDALDNERPEEIPISEPKPDVEIENGHQEMRKMENQEEVTLHRFNSLENVQFEVIHEPPPQPAQLSTKPQDLEERTTAKLPAELLSKPLVASTTGSGEGGSLTEEEAAIYRAKMAEQRRLAKERLAEQQRLEEEAEKERKAKRETERQAAIEAAREKAIKEARLAAEARMAKEAAEEQARLEAERKAQERADKDRQAMEAMMRERSERIRKSEEEREMRRKRLESIMSRVNRSDRSLNRGIPNSGSASSLTGSVTGVSSSNGIDEDSVKSGATVHFSLAPNNVESPSGVFQSSTSNGEGEGPALRGQQQNGFSEAAPRTTTFNSPLLTSLFSGGGFGGINSQRPTTSVTGVTGTNPSSDSALSSSRNNNMHSGEPQQPHPPASNLAMGTVGNASNS
ncbi:unnamed protein product [Hymenolepis diminuta]|uniref:Uncharacterized protein n=2 Tax=Hymenolepis diminuta TaxID=6216 RepID=A0A564Y7U1_HYMDI|nr:unnamed protein product [Hymenolepis diminuta]